MYSLREMFNTVKTQLPVEDRVSKPINHHTHTHKKSQRGKRLTLQTLDFNGCNPFLNLFTACLHLLRWVYSMFSIWEQVHQVRIGFRTKEKNSIWLIEPVSYCTKMNLAPRGIKRRKQNTQHTTEKNFFPVSKMSLLVISPNVHFSVLKISSRFFLPLLSSCDS